MKNDLTGFEALAKEIAAYRKLAVERLNRDIFADGAGSRPMREMAPSWSRRVRIRASDYLLTLWRALKGEDPYEDSGW